MGLFDLPAPLFQALDNLLASFLPSIVRILLWGVLAGWLTMVVYRMLSNQDKISALKAEQKDKQKLISDFDGEMDELLPLIFATLKLGFRQLGLAIGPALLATIPVLFLVAWVAGAFGHIQPEPGDHITVTTEPVETELAWLPDSAAVKTGEEWTLTWPGPGQKVLVRFDEAEILELPASSAVPVIHKKQWWNSLFGNPIGYVPDELALEALHIGLPAQSFIGFGPGWMQGWMFIFFMTFLLASLGFKFALKID